MLNEDLLGKKLYCVTGDGNEIPAERLRFKAVTCSEECAELRRRLLRKRVDDRQCRFCHKPSTPNARKAFARFRSWERKNPEQAYPDQWAIVERGGVSLKDFSKAVRQSLTYDMAVDSELYQWNWGSTQPHPDKPLPDELARTLEILKADLEGKETL